MLNNSRIQSLVEALETAIKEEPVDYADYLDFLSELMDFKPKVDSDYTLTGEQHEEVWALSKGENNDPLGGEFTDIREALAFFLDEVKIFCEGRPYDDFHYVSAFLWLNYRLETRSYLGTPELTLEKTGESWKLKERWGAELVDSDADIYRLMDRQIKERRQERINEAKQALRMSQTSRIAGF